MNTRKIARSAVFAGDGFIGLLDGLNTSPQLAYSIRRLTATSWATGDPLVRVRRSSDSEEANFSYDVTNVLSGSSISFSSSSGTTDGQTFTTWAGADTIYVAKWFNQIVGGNDAFNLTAGNQPLLDNSFNVLGNNVRNLALPTSITSITNYMSFTVGLANTAATWYIPFGSTSGTDYLQYYSLVNRVYNRFNSTSVFTTGVNAAFANNPIVCSTYRDTAASSTNNIWNINTGSYTVANSNTWGTLSNILHDRGTLAASQEPNRNQTKELIFFNNYNSSDYSTIRSDQSSFYGITI